jgi:hypothetical protein
MEGVGWLPLQTSAARPKCCSRASAMMNSSLSIVLEAYVQATVA